jgi:AraC-like DNA-binding protein
MNQEILLHANKLIKQEEINSTYLERVKLYKTSTFKSRGPLTYDFSLIIVLQGKKIGYLPNNTFEYHPSKYLVVPATIPFECETFASKEEPFICLSINIDKKIMAEIIETLSKEEAQQCKKTQLAIFTDDVTTQIQDVILRLLITLQSKEESMILGDALIKELFYRIAMGKNAYYLHKMFLSNNNESKIAKSLKTIHDQFNQPLDIPTLARNEDMSVSSFHTHFKKITSYSPLQYIKKMRLTKAKDLIEKENYQVNNTASAVGYESISQFSRDFKKYYGYPPKEAKVI